MKPRNLYNVRVMFSSFLGLRLDNSEIHIITYYDKTYIYIYDPIYLRDIFIINIYDDMIFLYKYKYLDK